MFFGKNRDRLSIFADILESANSGATKTRIMYKANLSYTLLGKYLDSALDLDFLQTTGSRYSLTEKGLEFLKQYRHFRERTLKAKALLEDLDRERNQLIRLCEQPVVGTV